MKIKRFISFEGIDGAGKTTQINLLKEKLKKCGFNVSIYREPGGTEITEKIREIILKKEFKISIQCELLLFLAARAELVRNTILHDLKNNSFVICDRFIDSTIVYQGYGRKIDLKLIERLNDFACENLDWAVLTTKGRDFAVELLDYMQLRPALIFGHEAGDKTHVLQEILSDRVIKGFVEDRRETLEEVLLSTGLSSIPCFLASWGYLKPEQDSLDLPSGIHLLNPETLAAPLASWY